MHFGVPRSRVYYVMDTVRRPADTFMVFELCRMTRRSPDYVLRTYNRHHHRGWGAMAHRQVRPGSWEFYAVRNGDFGYQPRYYAVLSTLIVENSFVESTDSLILETLYRCESVKLPESGKEIEVFGIHKGIFS